MSYSNKHCTRAALIAAVSATTLMLGACGQQRSVELSEDEQLLILQEIGLSESLIGYESATLPAGPSLIAGDWLAIQCAQASGYFDGYEWAPVYANVVSYDFE
jgi:hypothetical protein